jgi:hypothetical protein
MGSANEHIGAQTKTKRHIAAGTHIGSSQHPVSDMQDGAVGRNLLTKLDPLSRGRPQQIDDTQDDMSSSSFTLPSAYTIPSSCERPGGDFRPSDELAAEMVEIEGSRPLEVPGAAWR